MKYDKENITALKEKIKNFTYHQYVLLNLNVFIPPTDSQHIAQGLESIVNHIVLEYAPGKFIDSLLKNDLMETFFNADDINSRNMKIYVLFIYNIIPIGLRIDYIKNNQS